MARVTARQQALAEQKRATAKIQRLRKRGIQTDSIDPRRDTSGMTTPQLRKYRDQLQTFNQNRGYVAGLGGAPINRTAADYYKTLVNRNNRVSEQYEKNVGGIIVPTQGQDIASQIERRDRQKFTAGGEQALFQKITRKITDITGQDSILTLIANLKKKTNPQYFSDRMQQIRQTLNQMLEQSNDELSARGLALLSDAQLNVLVDYSPIMNALSGRYEYQKAMNTQEQFVPENWMTDIFDTNLDEIHELIDWAHNLDPTNVTEPAPVSDPNRRRRTVPRKRPRS